jgi:hypothetical protein
VAIVDIIYGILQLAGLVFATIAWLRSPQIEPEEMERANMRSLSWTTGTISDQ